jgi:hypothetical protein
VFYFLGYTNEIPLPNPDLRLYKSPALTFILVEQEEARRSLASRWSTRSRTRNEAGSSQQPLPTPTPPRASDAHVRMAPCHAYAWVYPRVSAWLGVCPATIGAWRVGLAWGWRIRMAWAACSVLRLRQVTTTRLTRTVHFVLSKIGQHLHPPRRVGNSSWWDSKAVVAATGNPMASTAAAAVHICQHAAATTTRSAMGLLAAHGVQPRTEAVS